MLAKHQRVATAADFKHAVRRGKRFTSEHAVVYVVGAPCLAHARVAGTARFGFIVSKSVGNAVERNRVRRRLRAIAADYLRGYAVSAPQDSAAFELTTTGPPQMVVVRMLPGAAQTPWSVLRSEVLSSFGRESAIR